MGNPRTNRERAEEAAERWSGRLPDDRFDLPYVRVHHHEVVDLVIDALGDHTFGEAVQQFAGRDDLPFLVRVAAGKAVKQVISKWTAAGEPDDVETLKTLFTSRST